MEAGDGDMHMLSVDRHVALLTSADRQNVMWCSSITGLPRRYQVSIETVTTAS